ncbi:MAG: hypothetical protein ACKVUS_01780 [Saprospiraceae bacterium]
MASKKILPSLLLILTNLTTIWGKAPQAAAATPAVSDPNGFANIISFLFLIMAGLLIVFAIAVMVRTNAYLSKNLIQLQSKK